ncbi:c-type cytochrome [Ideonella sp.]|uniref:c-type cytochrome n=1 Tax=Ideonella sp. TaxID=1929293 RepID=UPI002B487982|nr:c-type cytochrome [Ideonella sp.]HJV69461.1 c-type cytochrome [Ideonella sp.]
MSDAHAPAEQHEHDGPHEGPIKTPKQLVWAVVASFVVPIIVIIMLTQFVATGEKQAAGTDALTGEAVAMRIQPVGTVEIKEANANAAPRTGEQVFQAQCSACHATGAAGAPKFGDEAAWGPRIKQPFDALLNSALKGKNAMPPQGGGDFSDYEVARAVVYMANKGGAKFDEPKAPAPAASAAQ